MATIFKESDFADAPPKQVFSESDFADAPPTQSQGLLSSVADQFTQGIKSGAIYKGYIAEPSPGLPAPTPEERAAKEFDIISKRYDTKLSPQEETSFQSWKAQYAPKDSGWDYDLRGAYKAGLKPGDNGHWDDKFKKPNHPTFSKYSQYANDFPDIAGDWNGENYIPGPGRAARDQKMALAEKYWNSQSGAQPADPGIIAGTAGSIGGLVGKLPEMALGMAAGAPLGPVGMAVGGMASTEGLTAVQNPNATAGDVAKATALGAASGALMEAGGAVGGKLARAGAARLMGATEKTAAYDAATKAAEDALKAFRSAPSPASKAAAESAVATAKQAYKDIPFSVRAATGTGRFTGLVAGQGSAPILQGQMPTIKNYEDAFAFTLALESVGGINAVRRARKSLADAQKAGVDPGEATRKAVADAGLSPEEVAGIVGAAAPEPVPGASDQPVTVNPMVGEPFPAVPEPQYAPIAPGSPVMREVNPQLPSMPMDRQAPFPAVQEPVAVDRPQPTGNMRTFTRQGAPVPARYDKQWLLDTLNQLPPDQQEAWITQALGRTAEQPPAPTGNVAYAPEVAPDAQPQPMQRPSSMGVSPKTNVALGDVPAVEPKPMGGVWDRKMSPLDALHFLYGDNTPDTAVSPRDLIMQLAEKLQTPPKERVAEPVQQARAAGDRQMSPRDAMREIAGVNEPAGPVSQDVIDAITKGSDITPETAQEAASKLRRDYNAMTPEEQDAWAASLLRGEEANPEAAPVAAEAAQSKPVKREMGTPRTAGEMFKGESIERMRASAKPAQNGWLKIDMENGTILVHPTEDSIVPFATDSKNYYSQQKEKARADIYASENPVKQKTTEPEGNLVTKPIFDTPTAPPQPSAPTAPTQPKQPWEMTREEYEHSPYAQELSYDIAREGWIDAGHSLVPEFGKELWQMTQKEWRDNGKPTMNIGRKNGMEILSGFDREGISWEHHEGIRQALREGKPVPPEVLADYPDLQPKPQETLPETPRQQQDMPQEKAGGKMSKRAKSIESMREALSQYEDSGDLTGPDFVSRIQSLVDEGLAPKSLNSHISAFQKAREEHRKNGYRMDDGESHVEALADAVREKVSGKQKAKPKEQPIAEESPQGVDTSGIDNAKTVDEVNAALGAMFTGKTFPTPKQQEMMREAANKRVLELEKDKNNAQAETKPQAQADAETGNAQGREGVLSAPAGDRTIPTRTGELRQAVKSKLEPKVIVAKDPQGMLDAAEYLLTKDLPRNQMSRVQKIRDVAKRAVGAQATSITRTESTTPGVVPFEQAQRGDVYQIKMGDKVRYSVRENMDSPRGAGDRIYDSVEEARREWARDQEVKKSWEDSRARGEAERKANKEKEAAAKEKKNDLGGFADSMTPIQRGKVAEALNKQINRDGKIWTRREWIKDSIESGRRKPEAIEVPDEAARKRAGDQADRMQRAGVPTGNQNHPDTIKYNELREQEKFATKTEYVMRRTDDENAYMPVTKIEHDYAKHLERGAAPTRPLPPRATTDLAAALAQAGKWASDLHEQIKPHLAAILEKAKSAGDFVRTAVKQFGEAVRPYVKRFIEDQRGMAMKPTKWFDEFKAGRREGRREATKEAKAQTRDSVAEAKAEAREQIKEADAKAYDEGRARGESIGAQRQRQELQDFVKKAKEVIPPKQYNIRVKAMQKAIASGNSKNVGKILEVMRGEVMKAEAIRSLESAVKKLPKDKVSPELKARIDALKASMIRHKTVADAEGNMKHVQERGRYLRSLTTREVRRMRDQAEEILREHGANVAEKAEAIIKKRKEITTTIVDEVKKRNRVEHGKAQKKQSIARWAVNSMSNLKNLALEVADEDSRAFEILFTKPEEALNADAEATRKHLGWINKKLESAGVTPKDILDIREGKVEIGGVEIPRTEMASLYNHLKDPDTRAMLLRPAQRGVRSSDSLGTKRIKVTPEVISEIESKITDKERTLADITFKWVNSLAKDDINAWSKRGMGYEMFERNDHWPRRASLESQEPDIGLHANGTRAALLASAGFLKPREGGNHAIYLDDILTHTLSHVRSISKITTLQEPTVDARRMLDDADFQQALKERRRDGHLLIKELKSRIDDVATSSRLGGDPDISDTLIRKAGRAFTVAKLSLNVPVIISQPFSVASAQKIIPFKHVLKNMFHVRDTKAESEIREHSATLTGILDGTGHETITPGSSAGDPALRAFGVNTDTISDRAMVLVKKANDAAVYQIWDAAKSWGKEKGLSGKELMDFTAKTAEDAWLETQPNNSPIRQTGVKMRSKDSVAAYMFSMFQGQTAVQFNDALSEIRKYNAKEKKTTGDVKDLLVGIARPVILQAILFNTVKYGWNQGWAALTGETENERKRNKKMSPEARAAWNTLSDIMGSMPGFMGHIADSALEAVRRGASGEPLLGGGSDMPALEVLDSSANAIYEVTKAIANDEFKPSTYRALAGLADFSGIPIQKLYQTMEWLNADKR